MGYFGGWLVCIITAVFLARHCDVAEWRIPPELHCTREFPELKLIKIKQTFRRILRDHHENKHGRSS